MELQVPIYDHALLYSRDKQRLDEAIQRVLTSGQIDWGPEVPQFEAEFARWIGAAQAVGTNSGSAALKIALRALDIGPGAEVITVPNTDISTTAAIHQVGARAVWIDVEPGTLTMDPALVEAAITPRTRALLPVDLYGHPADLPALRAIAARHGLVVVEDACLALGASIHGRMVGRWADVTCFSFAPTKHLGGFGSGGMAVTDDPRIAARMQRLAAYGKDRARAVAGSDRAPALHSEEGANERLDELQAALLRAKLPGLSEAIARRLQCAAIYDDVLSAAGVRIPEVRAGYIHSYRNYVIQVDAREAVRAGLAGQGVASVALYSPPLHLQPVYAGLGHRAGDFPVAEAAADRQLALPIGPHLSGEQCEYTARALVDIVSGGARPRRRGQSTASQRRSAVDRLIASSTR